MERRKLAKTNLDGSAEGKMSLSLSLGQSQGQIETESDPGQGQGSEVKEPSVNDLPPEVNSQPFNCYFIVKKTGQNDYDLITHYSQELFVNEQVLPPEMLEGILKRMDTRTLFNCRLVNRQWNSMSNGIIHKRSDAKIKFTFKNKEFFHEKANEGKQRSLKDFLLCMKESKDCPVACFSFSCEEKPLRSRYLNFFQHEDFKAFLSVADESQEKKNQNANQNQNQNQRIKMKSLELKFRKLLPPFEPLMEHLRDLLLNKIPHLEELGLDFWSMTANHEEHPEIKLFSDSETAENKVVELAHLKVIRFNNAMVSECPELLKDLLGAAINLKKIYLNTGFLNFSPEPYDFLQPLGKSHLIKGVDFRVDGIFLSKVKERPDFSRDLLKLELEELTVDSYYELDGVDIFDANNFISSLCESNKNSLKKLTMRHISLFAQDFQFPRFQNLTELIIEPGFRKDSFLTPGGRALDIFPAVLKLDLSGWNWARAFSCEDSIPVFPRLQILKVTDLGFTGDSVPILTLLCPDLKHLEIQRDMLTAKMDFLDVGRSIWTHLKTLESLEVDIDVDFHMDFPRNTSLALDSCFTGISVRNCQRLFEMMEAEKTLGKRGFQCKIPESASASTAKREYPSILDMKNLKRLKINPYSRHKLWDAEDFFREKLTRVSEEYAFKFLPHLKPKLKPTEDEKLELV